MAIICPTILASDKDEYDRQLKNVSFADWMHIDFMDGSLTDSNSIALDEIELLDDKTVDLQVGS